MITRTIRNETDYDAALAEIDRLMAADPGTPESGGGGGSAVRAAAGGDYRGEAQLLRRDVVG